MTPQEIMKALIAWLDGQDLSATDRTALNRVVQRLMRRPRPCQRPGCQNDIPPTAYANAQTCSGACRVALHRHRHQ